MTSHLIVLSLLGAGAFALASVAWMIRKAPPGQRLWAIMPGLGLAGLLAWGGVRHWNAPTGHDRAASAPAAAIHAASPSVARGRVLARNLGCVGCHSEDGSRRIGPSFLGAYGARRELEGGGAVQADEAYLSRSIRDPKAQVVRGFPATMPEFGGRLGDDEVGALVAYLRDLRSP